MKEQAAASLAHKAVSAEQVRTLESKAAQAMGISLFELMTLAGEAAYHELCCTWPEAKRILVMAGNGNNGGDAYVVADIAKQAGLSVTLVCQDPERVLAGDAGIAQRNWNNSGGVCQSFAEVEVQGFDVIVDGLLGTGISGDVKGIFQQQILTANQSAIPVLALDIPSGLNADTGRPMPMAIQAQCTVSFVAVKTGLVTGLGKHYTGELIYADLGIGEVFHKLTDPKVQMLDWPMLKGLDNRPVHGNKGTFGKLLCIGGNTGMAGAIRLAAESALRTGSGMVKVHCHTTSAGQVAAGRPELMLSSDNLSQSLQWATCIAIGPGLGQDDWATQQFEELFHYLAQNPKPLVIDADGLNLLAAKFKQNEMLGILDNLPSLVLTPHPGEAARLLNVQVDDIEYNRYAACANLATQYSASCVLKGAGSVISHSKSSLSWVCTGGNPGMATAGMGDVLTGIVGGLLAQGLPSEQAAIYATCIHAEAGDRTASEGGQRGMIASDLFLPLRNIVNKR